MRTPVHLSLAALALGLTACIGGHSPEARFFQLQPSRASPSTTPLDPSIFLIVKPVVLESYLRQPQMADRVGTHEVDYSEFSRWAEPLDRNITRVVTENLRHLLQTDHVAVTPQVFDGARIVTLTLEVKRFERQPDGAVLLSASWQLDQESVEGPPRMGSAELTARAAGETAEARAAAQSGLLAELCARIAAETIAIASAPPAAASHPE